MMNSGAGAVPFDPPIHSGAGHPEFHAFGHNRLVQGFALPFVAFTEMNS
jgi:hypothetical protein